MLLSESEAFWLAMVYQELSWVHCLDGDAPDAKAQGFRVFKKIRELAVNFGLARPAEMTIVHDEKPVTPPDDVMWSAGNGSVLTADDYDAVRATVATQFQEIQDTVENSSAFEKHAADFVCRARNVLAGYIIGYAPSTPGVLYHVSTLGEPCVLGSVARRDPGLYLTMLGLLRRHLPLPPIERMAMSRAGFSDELLGHTCFPTLANLEQPVGSFDHDGIVHVLADFQASNSGRPGWDIGEELTLLLTMARQAADGMSQTASMLDCYESDGTAADDPDASAYVADDEDDAPDIFSSSYATDTPAAAVDALLRYISSEMTSYVKTMRAGDDANADDKDTAFGHCQYELDQFRDAAMRAAALCRQNNLTGVAEMVLVARDAAPSIEWRNPLQTALHDYTSVFADTIASTFEAATQVLADARNVAYGELRLRDLKWDEHGLTAPALTGWARQHGNVQAAIKTAIDQLNNGLPPYVVLSQLASVPEVLVRQLAAKHLKVFPGLNTGGLLKALRQTIGTESHDSRDKVTLSVAHTLVSIRNCIAHEANAEWGRDYAAFFLNGLSLLLQEV